MCAVEVAVFGRSGGSLASKDVVHSFFTPAFRLKRRCSIPMAGSIARRESPASPIDAAMKRLVRDGFPSAAVKDLSFRQHPIPVAASASCTKKFALRVKIAAMLPSSFERGRARIVGSGHPSLVAATTTKTLSPRCRCCRAGCE